MGFQDDLQAEARLAMFAREKLTPFLAEIVAFLPEGYEAMIAIVPVFKVEDGVHMGIMLSTDRKKLARPMLRWAEMVLDEPKD